MFNIVACGGLVMITVRFKLSIFKGTSKFGWRIVWSRCCHSYAKDAVARMGMGCVKIEHGRNYNHLDCGRDIAGTPQGGGFCCAKPR